MRAPHERASAMADSSAGREAGEPSVGTSMCLNMVLSPNVLWNVQCAVDTAE